MNDYDQTEEIIPRPIGRVKAQLVARFKLGLKDILVFLAVIISFAFMSFTLITNMWVKLGVGFVVGGLLGGMLLIGEPNRRVYNNLYKFVIFLVTKKKYAGKEVDKLLPYSSLEGKYIKDKDGKWISVIRIFGNNIMNMKKGQQLQMLHQFANLYVGETKSTYLTKLETPYNTEAQQQNVLDLLKKYKDNPKRKQLLEHNLGVNGIIGGEDNSVANYFMVLANRNKKTLEADIMALQNQLTRASIQTERLEDRKLFRYAIWSIFPNLTVREQLLSLDYKKVHYFKDLINIDKVDIKGRYISYGEKKMKIIAIDQYPIKSSLSWLSPLFNIPNSSVFLRSKGLSQLQANALLDKAHQEMRMRAIGSNITKLSENSSQAIYMEAMEDLAVKVQGTGETLINTQIYIVVYGNNYRELLLNEKQVISEIGKNRMKVDKLLFNQLQAFLSISAQGDVSNFYERNNLEIGSTALSQAWPFISESFDDKGGTYLGLTQTGKPVFLDWRYRNTKENRNQSNSIIFGATGKGKSTFVKKVLKDEWAMGTTVYVVDPENEYEDLCKNVGGTYIDLSGRKNSKGKIERLNPLQPFATGEGGRNPLDNHFKFLESFFRALLYPSQKDVVLEMGYLKFAITNLYKKLKLTGNEKNEKWPILTDLYKHLLKLSREKVVKNSTFDNKGLFKELAERMYDLTSNGTDGNLWDGNTTLNIVNDEMVVLNIQELYSSGNSRLINSQMYLMLNYLTYLVERNKRENNKRNHKKNISITIDEAHLLVNKENPTTLQFAYNMYKRIRKYDGWMRMVTQNIADFTGSEEVKRETGAILNSAQFLFVFGLNSNDIKDLNELLRESGGLTDYEKAFLNMGETHSSIFLSGQNYRSTINLEYTDEEKVEWGWKEKI